MESYNNLNSGDNTQRQNQPNPYEFVPEGNGYYIVTSDEPNKRFTPRSGTDFKTRDNAERFINRQVQIYSTKYSTLGIDPVEYGKRFVIMKSEKVGQPID